MRTQVFAVAVFTVLPGLGYVGSNLAVNADASAAQQAIDIRFRGMDQNGDRVITRAEWRGSDRSFQIHDWNGDGVLSGEEVRPGATRRTDQDFNEGGNFTNWTARGFRILDQNSDGRITRNEWYFNREDFIRADRNRDNVLSRAEFLGEGVDDDRNDRFEYLDVDNSGRIERDEWHGGRQEFASLDRNNDGVLSRAEVVGSAVDESPSSDLFARLDVNRNGVISFNEWQWSRASFDQRDDNRDGRITRAEFGNVGAGNVGAVGTTGRTIVVPSTERWTDSGIVVRRGDVLHIDASGTITMSGNAEDTATPEGSRTGRRANEAPLPQQSAGGLLMRIGESQPIFVGSSARTIRAFADGRVYFGVNDDHLGDNRGEFRVSVRMQ